LSEEKIQKLTYNDKLTGLYNRLYYDIAINEMFDKREYPISIIMGDINGLKLTNDAFGHKSGDDLLILAAEIIKSSCRKQDIAARLSGDEFSIIMPGADKSEAEKVCEKIRCISMNSSINQMCLSIALGHATTTSEIDTMGEILREAEDAMYRNKLNESRSIRSTIITTLQASLEQKTLETKEHAERISIVSMEIGKALGFSHDQMEELSIASSMHDIGKTGIPDAILSKPGSLTSEEWQIMRKHPEIGYHILLSSPTMSKIAEYILAHHERWDGNGYPQGLMHEDIPIISRIIAIADTYDVIMSDRPYRKAVSKEEALDEIIRCSGTQFDPSLVKVFVRLTA
jgi:diguanylate cyclase (GGDEF)-like protein